VAPSKQLTGIKWFPLNLRTIIKYARSINNFGLIFLRVSTFEQKIFRMIGFNLSVNKVPVILVFYLGNKGCTN